MSTTKTNTIADFITVACPRCFSAIGVRCRNISGTEVGGDMSGVHGERAQAYVDRPQTPLDDGAKPSASFLLANLVLDVAYKRENAYDWAQSVADTVETLRLKAEARAAKPNDPYADAYAGVSRDDYYTLSLYEAARQVCDEVEPALHLPVYLLLTGTWNESLDWAVELTGRKIESSPERLKWDADMDEAYEKWHPGWIADKKKREKEVAEEDAKFKASLMAAESDDVQDMDKVREAVDKTIAEGHGANMVDFNRNLKADTSAFEQFVNRLEREPK